MKRIFAILLIAAVLVSGCAPGADPVDNVLRIGATPVPHAEILEIVKEELAKQDIILEIVEYTDYVQPNLALDSGDLDANFFQHMPYLNNFNEMNGTDIVPAVAVHFEPLGLYPGRMSSLSDITDGATIAVPNDTTNGARALLMLEAAGLITMPPDSGLFVTPRDIVSNPKNLSFHEIEAALIPSILPDVDMGVINGNFAIGAGLQPEDMLASEGAGSAAADRFANVVAVNAGDENRPEILKLVEAVTSQAVRDFVEEKYRGAVVPVF
ncbi:MAG: MetQ/NlpA family ABC transporter substrate-binding protein [Defluviitaleaceae bacterium]|nr:MetQ/NlpA family ABC transporter substrate-binding protein [Defluviitaleaceae bacterium]